MVFYDVETFKYDALVTFKDIDKNILKQYHNDFTGLHTFIKDKILVSFNGYSYDDVILTGMLSGYSNHQLKNLNDRIIGGERITNINKDIESLDVFREIDASRPSLGRIQANMGETILESSVPFDIDRPLTDEELEETWKYNEFDVDMVIEIYKIRKHQYFDPKKILLDRLNKPYAKRWNTTTISANLLLGNKPLVKWSDVRVPEVMLDMVPLEVKNMWEEANSIGMKLKTKTVTISEFDNDITFAYGGLHGEHKTIKEIKDVVLLDVSGYYPSIIINNEVLGSATEEFKQIRDERNEVKATDPILSDTLKLITNSVYGNLRNKYSLLNNPRASVSVCIYGQIALYELCKRVAPYATIVNINTDGVVIKPYDDTYKRVAKDWEEEFNFNLDEETFDLFIQSNVNSYIAVRDMSLKDDTGKVKAGYNIVTKGGDVGKYDNDALFRNNAVRIVDKAVVDLLVNEIDIIDTLLNHLHDPKLYQFILQAGPTYLGTYDNNDNKYQKVNRVFASKTGDLCLYKKRPDKGMVRFPTAPDKMLVWNHNCIEIENFKDIVDLNHYYQMILNTLERW